MVNTNFGGSPGVYEGWDRKSGDVVRVCLEERKALRGRAQGTGDKIASDFPKEPLRNESQIWWFVRRLERVYEFDFPRPRWADSEVGVGAFSG